MKILSKSVIFILFFSFSWEILTAETVENLQLIDSLNIMMRKDSVKMDSISYFADSIYYSVTNQKIRLCGNSKLHYHSAKISADSIVLDIENEQAFAMGKSSMQDVGQDMLGNDIYFDLQSEWGLIKSGTSRFDKGFYDGDEIRKIGENTFDIDDGKFTTCDAFHPHFYIKAKKLRFFRNDKIVAKPIVFYANHFPIMAFPFGTFPIKHGRISGILVPSPGYNKNYGKYIENIAFYYAFKDYADATLIFDYYEGRAEAGGWNVGLKSNYIKRYIFNGNFDLNFQKEIAQKENDTSKNEWEMKGKHHHEFGNKTTFDADLHFVSSTEIWSASEVLDERLKEKITSTMLYKSPSQKIYAKYNDDFEDEKRDFTFSATKYSFLNSSLKFSADFSEYYTNEMSDTNFGKKSITLPSMSYSLSSPIYEIFLRENDEIPENIWWKDFSFSYKFKGIHEGEVEDENATLNEIFYLSKGDSVQHNAGAKNTVDLRYVYKFDGWLNLSQTATVNGAIFDRDMNNEKFANGYDYSMNSRLSFSAYGLRKLRNPYLKAVRHIISPSFNFSYNPDFSENEKFYNFGGIGLENSEQQRKISFSLENKWQLKLAKTKNLSERKINDFFTIKTSGIAYDFEKNKQNENGFSETITHLISLNPNAINYKIVDFSIKPTGTIQQKIYDLDFKNFNLPIDDWSLSVSSNLKFSGDAQYIDYFPLQQNEFIDTEFLSSDSLDFDEKNLITSLMQLDEMEREKKNWAIIFSHSYSTNKSDFEKNDFSSSLRTSISAKITKNWAVTYDNYINLKENELVSHNFTVTREMHCWKLFFRYTKQGDYWNYRLQFFNIKLPDALKFRTSGHS